MEIEFTQEAARHLRSDVEGAVKEYVAAADAAYAQQAVAHSLHQLLERAVKRVLAELSSPPDRYRATVHVPDVIYTEYFYQLLPYFPDGRGVARRFSQRRGMLGRAWRLGVSEGLGDALREERGTGNLPSSSDETDDDILVREWSMTRQEIQQWNHEPKVAFLCVLLRVPFGSIGHGDSMAKVPGRQVGVFYMDSTLKDAFGKTADADRLAKSLENSPEVRALAIAVDSAMVEMRGASLNLEIQNA